MHTHRYNTLLTPYTLGSFQAVCHPRSPLWTPLLEGSEPPSLFPASCVLWGRDPGTLELWLELMGLCHHLLPSPKV